MLSKAQSQRLRRILKRFDDIDATFIREVAERIAEIHDMEALNLVMLILLVNEQSAAIESELNTAINKSVPEIKQMYGEALNDVYKSKRFAGALKEKPLPKDVGDALDDHVAFVSRQTVDSMRLCVRGNRISPAYQKAVNDAFLVRSSGVKDYTGMTRHALREVGTKGIRAGDGWRMSNAIKRVILDGIQTIQQKANDVICVALGFDAKEISVHVNSAPDHEPVQGRVFLNSEFEKLQHGQDCVDIDGRHYPAMERPIGALNCRHIVYGFSTKRSKRRYTPEQLDAMIERNARGCDINGKHYTLYDAKQYLGRLEAAERKQLDIARTAEAAGDKVLLQDCANSYKAIKDAEVVVQGKIENGTQNQPSNAQTTKHFSDVADEYIQSAEPGKGNIVHDSDFDVGRHKDEIQAAEYLHNKYGGNIKLLTEANRNGVKTPDYEWNGKLWELKSPSNEKAIDSQLRKGLQQIAENPGGIVINYGNVKVDDALVLNNVRYRVGRSSPFDLDVLIIREGMDDLVIRYKK